MGFETRNGRGCYYTRSIRQDDRVVRQYVGTGRPAELAAQLDEIERQEREQEREAARQTEQAFEAEIAPLEQALDALDTVCEALMKGALEKAGFHRPQRGKWMKQRDR